MRIRQRFPRAHAAGWVWITAGYVAVAISSVVLLAAGPRVLGPAAFSTLALEWTLSTLFGLGLGNPTEQVVTRRLSAGEPHALRPLRWLSVWAVLSGAAVALFGGSFPSAQNGTGFVPGTVAAVAGWVAACWVRGRFAGGGNLTRYAVVLLAEAVFRVGLVGLALAVPGSAGTFLAGAVGVPLLLAAGVGVFLRRRAVIPVSALSSDHVGEHLYFGIVSVAYQACLNGPALVLDRQVGAAAPALVGAFVAVSTVLRSPSLLVGGLSTDALVKLSRSWARGDGDDYAAGTRRLGIRWARLVVPTTGLVLLLSPWLLPLYYGSPVGLSPGLVVALAVSTVFATGAAVGTGPLFAAGRGRTAALAWGVGAVLTMGLVATSSGSTPWLAVALMAGPLAAAVIVVRAVFRTLGATGPAEQNVQGSVPTP